ncbi:MAG: hypothetical protein ACREBU_12790 [Nitrososphaera sp.]
MDIEQEIQEWRLFESALREENREFFERMLKELEPEILHGALGLAKDPFEVLAMALIFNQQKMISRLLQEFKKRKG